jgi:hypothetical protein
VGDELSPRITGAIFLVILSVLVIGLRWDSRSKSEIVDLDLEEKLWISAPCKVEKIGSYLDGGSIGGILKDAQGRKVGFFWDGAMRNDSPENPYRNHPRLAYLGSDHPVREGANPIPLGSKGESEFIHILSDWVSSEIPPSEQEHMYSTYFNYSIPGEERMKLLPGFTKEHGRALLALKVVKALEKQRKEFGYESNSQ